MRSWHYNRARFAMTLAAALVGGTIACTPEPSPPTPATADAPPVPTATAIVPPRARLRPTAPSAVDRSIEPTTAAAADDTTDRAAAKPPTVDADAVPDIGKAPLHVRFEARVDAGSEAYTCDWDFGDGATATGNPVEHEFTAPGSFTAQVRVTTSSGATAAYPVGVEVDPPADGGGADVDDVDD